MLTSTVGVTIPVFEGDRTPRPRDTKQLAIDHSVNPCFSVLHQLLDGSLHICFEFQPVQDRLINDLQFLRI